MQLKLRHLILFLVAALVLILGGMPGGALLAMAALMQLALLINGIPLSKKSQLGALKIFLLAAPVMFFWGGAHSFVEIYLRESAYLYSAMAVMISLSLCFIINFQAVFVFKYLQAADFAVNASLQDAFNDIKNKRTALFLASLALFLLTLVPVLSADWKLVFAIMVLQLFLNFDRVKTALASF
jgi:hypothetical protein